ncbi:Hypothetical predicted protein [Cloeon dipterum]|uniref:Uncharacterized protein n=1 Tax=Cloeon dipterum TaxID=197152 RepID=A0A8S1D2M9_9INSE|nr:Hypothetical predicted protein [Cloeon dipterum]
MSPSQLFHELQGPPNKTEGFSACGKKFGLPAILDFGEPQESAAGRVSLIQPPYTITSTLDLTETMGIMETGMETTEMGITGTGTMEIMETGTMEITEMGIMEMETTGIGTETGTEADIVLDVQLARMPQ